MGVFDHDVGAEPETNLARVVWNLGFGPDVVRYEEVRVDFLVISIVLLFEHGDHLEGPLDLRKFAFKTGLLAD